jgi:chemotaxis protein CheX
MKVEYINPFIQASNAVIRAICGVEARMGRVSLKSNTFFLNHLIIVIHVSGNIEGKIFFEMNTETAKRIATSMMGGRHIIKLDEISISAICEMGNMIIGNASTIFSENSIDVYVNSPTVLVGEKIQMQNKIPTFIIPIKLDKLGELKIYINAKEKIEDNFN